jgi:uncharacterized membrane protein YqjE
MRIANDRGMARTVDATATGSWPMMVAVFATMSLALICVWLGPRWLSIAAFAASLVLASGLFLWEIYDPQYGFRMPWIQTESKAGPARS